MMNSRFLNNLLSGLGKGTSKQVPAEQTDQPEAELSYLPREEEAVDEGSINWGTIIEESGSSQSALHMFLIGFGEE